MKVSAKKNDGVSPVIGTILLVAITVVLVAIISAVVMGMTNDIGSSKIVGVQVTPGADKEVFVTITGGASASELESLDVYFNGTTPADSTIHSVKVGKPNSVTNTTGGGMTLITVTGTFKDGSVQSLYSSEMSI